MRKINLKQWYSAAHLKTEEDMAQYLDACLQAVSYTHLTLPTNREV